MKLLIAFILLVNQCIAQTITKKQAAKLSKEITDCIRKNSLFKDSLDLDELEDDFKQHIDTFDTYKEVGYYYTRLLRQAGDKHSFYVSQADMNKFSNKQKDNIEFKYELMDGNIGYLSIPGFLSTDMNVVNGFADQVLDAIVKLDSSTAILGWIVDLRNNTGGNMWPMLLGLNPLIGSNEVPGYFTQSDGKKANPWKITSPSNGVTLKRAYQLKNPNAKIAVLYSPRTGSSGEATAISFIGKPNTRSFGERTAGYTTANEIFYLSDGNIFVLAVSCEMDRNKKIYMGSLTPDVLVENSNEDGVTDKAKEWLKE